MPETPTCFAISDGAAGNERQVGALADAMGLPARRFRLALPPPWSWLAPRLELGAWRALPKDLRDAAEAAPPGAIAIGCGRAAALATALLRRRGCYAIQILDPRAAPGRWDVVIAPRHDGLAAANAIATVGALNDISPARLVAAAQGFAALCETPSPRTAVLIGGSNRAQRIDRAYLGLLLERLEAVRGGGAFLITCSRRTDPAVLPALSAFAARHGAVLWRDERDGANPYHAFLALADRVVATPDSVNLLSEAAASGKPAYTFAPAPVRGKLARFHEALRAGDHVRPLERFDPAWGGTPLRETGAVAREAWSRYRAAQGSP